MTSASAAPYYVQTANLNQIVDYLIETADFFLSNIPLVLQLVNGNTQVTRSTMPRNGGELFDSENLLNLHEISKNLGDILDVIHKIQQFGNIFL